MADTSEAKIAELSQKIEALTKRVAQLEDQVENMPKTVSDYLGNQISRSIDF